MSIWLVWLIAGLILIFLELLIPGGVVVFLGLAAIAVALTFFLGLTTTVVQGLTAWFIISIVFLLFLRALFMKYFEGNSRVQDVSEEQDYMAAIVEVVEKVVPYKEGRVSFRGTTWIARSEEEFEVGEKAVIIGRDGNTFLVKSIEE